MKNDFQNTIDTKESILSDGTRHLLTHHLESFQDNNLEAVISDYTDESVMITQTQTYYGRTEIKAFFSELIKHFPKQKSKFQLEKLVVIDEFAYIVWNAKTPSVDVPLGTDTFVIRDGKIHQQTFAGQLNFIN